MDLYGHNLKMPPLQFKAKFHYASWFEAGSKLVGDQLRTTFEAASVMEFGF